MSRTSSKAMVIGMMLGCFIASSLYNTLKLPKEMHASLIQHVNKQLSEDSENSNELYKTDSNSSELYKTVRVLCLVLTAPKYHKTRARAVNETWGKHCNVLLFVSTESDLALPVVKVNVSGNYSALWGKTREAFHYVWENHRDEADWFLKADDDTYVVLENLRYFLSSFNTSYPMYFGFKFNKIVKQGYFSGGSGYVLSKEAITKFGEEGYKSNLLCRVDPNSFAEDAEMGKCMENLNVKAMDTRDSKGRGRFFPLALTDHVNSNKIDKTYWYWKNIYYPAKMGLDCCSDTAISFHYVGPEHMRLFEYLIYQLQVHGISEELLPATPEPPPDLELTETPWTFEPDKTTQKSANETEFDEVDEIITKATPNATQNADEKDTAKDNK